MNTETLFLNPELPIVALLQPISDAAPCGLSMKLEPIYSDIQQARSADDPNLPMGDWEHSLKTADWERVSDLATTALRDQTKDLQVATWLLEAEIHLQGFKGIAPCVTLMMEMSRQYWQDLHPQVPNGDLEYRTNIFAWMNDKLQPALCQLPITQASSGPDYCWVDWQRALMHDAQPADRRSSTDESVPTLANLHFAITATPIIFYRELVADLNDGVSALKGLSELLDNLLKQDAPSVSGLIHLLEGIRDSLSSQVKGRGLLAVSQDEADTEGDTPADPSGASQGGGGAPVKNRAEAYAQLAEAAEFLKQQDPHSPVPYLIYKAIDWGQLDTAELYQELFVQYQGQLNIFDLLGLDVQDTPR